MKLVLIIVAIIFGLSTVSASGTIDYPESGYEFFKITKEAHYAMPEDLKDEKYGCVARSLWTQEYCLNQGVLVNIEIMYPNQYYDYFGKRLPIGYSHAVISAITSGRDDNTYIWYVDGLKQAKGEYIR